MKQQKKFTKSSPKKFFKPLSKTQKEYLSLFSGEKYDYPLTPEQIAKQRKVSLEAVWKMRRKLINLGVFSKGFQKVHKSKVTQQPIFKGNSYIRRHAEHWNIRIIWSGNFYQKLLKKANRITRENNTITLHKRTINIYSKNDFKADDIDKADYNAQEYWLRFFMFLQDELGIIILKERRDNIKLCRIHYADVHNGVAKKFRQDKNKLRIYDMEDGKLRLITDYSNLTDELETQHPSKASEDMKRIKNQKVTKKQLIDFMDNDPPTNTELANILKSSLNLQVQTQEQLKVIALAFESNAKQINSLVKTLSILIPKEQKDLRKYKMGKFNPQESGIL